MSDLGSSVRDLRDRPPFSSTSQDDDSDSLEARPEPIREGLPPTYRMRADAHYVEQLNAPAAPSLQMISSDAIESTEPVVAASVPQLLDSITRHGVLEPLIVQKRDDRYVLIAGAKRLAVAKSIGLSEVPCIVHRIDDDKARMWSAAARSAATRLVAPHLDASTRSAASTSPADVVPALTAVLSCTDLISDAVPPLTRQVAVDMIRAETQRALCAVQTARTLTHGVARVRRFAVAQQIIARVNDIIAADSRLRRIRVSTSVAAEQGTKINMDEQLLASSLSAVVFMLSAALDDGQDAGLDVTATTASGGLVTFAAVHDSVVVPDVFLNVSPSTEAKTLVAMRPLLALRDVADAYGGTLRVERLAYGTRISVDFPAVR